MRPEWRTGGRYAAQQPSFGAPGWSERSSLRRRLRPVLGLRLGRPSYTAGFDPYGRGMPDPFAGAFSPASPYGAAYNLASLEQYVSLNTGRTVNDLVFNPAPMNPGASFTGGVPSTAGPGTLSQREMDARTDAARRGGWIGGAIGTAVRATKGPVSALAGNFVGTEVGTQVGRWGYDNLTLGNEPMPSGMLGEPSPGGSYGPGAAVPYP